MGEGRRGGREEKEEGKKKRETGEGNANLKLSY